MQCGPKFGGTVYSSPGDCEQVDLRAEAAMLWAIKSTVEISLYGYYDPDPRY